MNARIIFKNATILTLDKAKHLYENYDLVVSNKKITNIEKNVNVLPDDTVIDCSNKLITPGFINAHLHSVETSFRGMFDNLPLEQWMLYSYPPSSDFKYISERFAYLRTMCGAIEQIQSGVTCCQDDASGTPTCSVEEHDQIFQAYADLGMKANVSFNVMNKEYLDIVPYVKNIPDELKEKLLPPASDEEILALNEELIKKWNNKNNMKILISNSAPQRCTDSFSQKLFEQAVKYDLPFHTHICETRVQRVTGFEFYGKTILQHADDIGIIAPRTTIAHCNWLDDDDIRIVAERGANIAHNIVSNLKLGSGIMPFRKMMKNGVHLALGTDGTSSNDSQNILEVMKTAALVHKVPNPDYDMWPDSQEILDIAAPGGARSVMRETEIGSLEVGKSADLLIFDLTTPAFTPLNNIQNQLVYCENGSSLTDVYIDGAPVMQDKKILTVDTKALLAEFRELHKEFLEMYASCKTFADKMLPYIDKAHWKCINQFRGF